MPNDAVNVLVCIKRVPDFSGEVLLTEDAQAADARFVGFTLRDHDSCAVELAVQIASATGGQATVATVGSADSVEQLRSALGVADNVLSRRLAAMVEAGLLTRAPYDAGNRTREEYLLTPAGTDLFPVLHALAQWGERHRPAADGRRLDVVHEGCGEVTGSADTCTACGERLRAGTVSWRRPRDPSVLAPLVR